MPYRLQEYFRRKKYPAHLQNFEKKVFSQNGEDGIIEEIFNRIGTTNKTFVEFGVENGTENNSIYLLKEKKWHGLWIEGVETCFNKASEFTKGLDVKIDLNFVTVENILDILNKYDIPRELDFLSVDIDGNDYYVLSQILSTFRPRVVCVEYNASVGPESHFKIEYDPSFRWDTSKYFGASLQCMNDILNNRDYRLVSCDAGGVNAFFVRRDLLQGKFIAPENPVHFFYSAPKYGQFFGHIDQELLRMKS